MSRFRSFPSKIKMLIMTAAPCDMSIIMKASSPEGSRTRCRNDLRFSLALRVQDLPLSLNQLLPVPLALTDLAEHNEHCGHITLQRCTSP